MSASVLNTAVMLTATLASKVFALRGDASQVVDDIAARWQRVPYDADEVIAD